MPGKPIPEFSVSAGTPVPLHQMGTKVFERLCSELFEIEPDIVGCDLYGVGGQDQFGVDLIARTKNGLNIEVGQCKCYENFSRSDIKKASKAFFNNWDHVWLEKGVTRFILFIGCEIEETQKQDEIELQRREFEKFGIRYEAWPASRIIKRLRPHPGIVSSHFKPAELWVKEICGDVVELPQPSRPGLSLELNLHLSAIVSGAFESTFVNIRKAWQMGRRNAARKLLHEAIGDPDTFAALPGPIRATLTRFRAIDILESGGEVKDAATLASEAASIDPSSPGTIQLKAIIEVQCGNLTFATSLLEGATDLESIQLRTSIFVAMGRISEAETTLAAISNQTPTAETHRLQSLIFLLKGEVTSALLSSQKAVELQPFWPRLLFINAALEYCAGLVTPPRILPNRPEPVSWVFVRRDDESRSRFAHAASVFEKLLSDGEISNADTEALEAWKLSCVANQIAAQDQASDLCAAMLKRRPGRLDAIAWAVARGLDVDLARSESKVKDLVNSGNGGPEDIIALVAIYYGKKQWPKAERLLDRHKRRFVEPSDVLIWQVWKAQSLAARGLFAKAKETLGDFSSGDATLSLLHATLTAAEGDRHGEGTQALSQWFSLYETTREPVYLLCAFTVAEGLRDSKFLSEHATEILRTVGTAEIAARMVRSLFADKQYNSCLTVLAECLRLFPNEILSTELRQFRIACQERTGLISAALEEAERLAHDEPSLTNNLGLCEIYFVKGDLRRLVILARKALNKYELRSVDALRLAWQTQYEDRKLAQALWHSAANAGIEDAAVLEAIRLGYSLGLDEYLGLLTSRAEDLARKGISGFRIASREEIIEQSKKLLGLNIELWQQYLKGQIPFHFISARLNLSIAELYHGRIADCLKSTILSEEPVVLARFGGRPVNPNSDVLYSARHLYVDVTSLLLAADLNILQTVEEQYGPLQISRFLVRSLIAMREQLLPHQPSRVSDLAAVHDLIASDVISIIDLTGGQSSTSAGGSADGLPWPSVGGTDRLKEGYLVNLQHEDTVEPNGVSSDANGLPVRVINCRTFVEALRHHGPLGPMNYQTAVGRLGLLASEQLLSMPNPGEVVYLTRFSAEVLASTGVLTIGCERFRCYMPASDVRALEDELTTFSRQQELEKWIALLIDRVSNGIDRGVYEVVASPEMDNLAAANPSIDTLCLVSLLNISPTDNRAVWIDDRWANRHLQAGTVPIIDVLYVLNALRASKSISDDKYFEALLRLRAGNVLFIPFTPDEFSWHLRNASVQNNIIVETTELIALRRGVATSLLNANLLQQPTNQQIASGIFEEGVVILSLHNSITESLLHVWQTGEALEYRRARADWLLECVYVDSTFTKRLVGVSSDREGALALAAARFAMLLSKAFHLSLKGNETSLRAEYVEWLSMRLLDEAIKNEPRLVAMTADVLKRMILTLAPASLRSYREKVELSCINSYILSLPGEIQNELLRDADFSAKLRIQSVAALDIVGLRFEREAFLRAAQKAVNGIEATLRTVKEEKRYKLNLGVAPPFYALRIIPQSADVTSGVDLVDPIFGILSDSPSLREESLKGQRRLFDMGEEDFAAFTNKVASGTDARLRFERVEAERAKGATYYYGQLRLQLKANPNVDPKLFILADPDMLGRHYRLRVVTGQVDVATEFADGAIDLLQDESLLEVVLRLARLPIPLPRAITERVDLLSAGDRTAFFNSIITSVHSPISFWHIVRLLINSGDRHLIGSALVEAERALAADEEFEAFKSILVWCAGEFKRWAASRILCDGLCIAFTWCHSHQIFTILKADRITMAWIREYFDALANKSPHGLFEVESRLSIDVSFPARVDREVFLTSCLEYACPPSTSSPFPETFFDVFHHRVTVESEAGPFPSLSLFLDSAAVLDQLGSIFGGNRRAKLLSLIRPDARERFALLFEDVTIEGAVRKLEENPEASDCWNRLVMAVGPGILPRDYAQRLGAIILASNLAQRVSNGNLVEKLMPLSIASMYARQIEDEAVAKHLTDCLIASANTLGRTRLAGELEKSASQLVECALHLALCIKRSAVLDEFAKIVRAICHECPTIAGAARRIVQIICESVPMGDADLLWDVNVYLRTFK